jgi:hypothetical protein
MMFELLLKVMDLACEIQTLNTPSPVAKRSIGGLEIFDGSKLMISAFINGQSRMQGYKETDMV